jgi:hypothetical protein
MKLRLKAARDTFRHHLNEQKNEAKVKEEVCRLGIFIKVIFFLCLLF